MALLKIINLVFPTALALMVAASFYLPCLLGKVKDIADSRNWLLKLIQKNPYSAFGKALISMLYKVNTCMSTFS